MRQALPHATARGQPDEELERLSVLAWERLRAVVPSFADDGDLFLTDDEDDVGRGEGGSRSRLISWKEAVIALGEDLEEDELITELRKSTAVIAPSMAAQLLSAHSMEEAAAAMAIMGGGAGGGFSMEGGGGGGALRRAGSASMAEGWSSPSQGLIEVHSGPAMTGGGSQPLEPPPQMDDDDFTDMLVAPPAPTHDRSL